MQIRNFLGLSTRQAAITFDISAAENLSIDSFNRGNGTYPGIQLLSCHNATLRGIRGESEVYGSHCANKGFVILAGCQSVVVNGIEIEIPTVNVGGGNYFAVVQNNSTGQCFVTSLFIRGAVTNTSGTMCALLGASGCSIVMANNFNITSPAILRPEYEPYTITSTIYWTENYHPNATTTGTVTLVSNTDASVQRFTTTLTGNLIVTLSTAIAYTGQKFRIIAPAALGGFSFTANSKSMTAGQWADFMFDGSAWQEIAGGTLL
jgi:hypothetical protein